MLCCVLKYDLLVQGLGSDGQLKLDCLSGSVSQTKSLCVAQSLAPLLPVSITGGQVVVLAFWNT